MNSFPKEIFFGLSKDSRNLRFRMPYVILLDVPSGNTSHNRTASCPLGEFASSVTVNSGEPTISSSSFKAFVSKQSEKASSRRWSPGSSGPNQIAQYSPPLSPQCCGLSIIPNWHLSFLLLKERTLFEFKKSFLFLLALLGQRSSLIQYPSLKL